MFNPFYEYISPDQGYYTQQPATVDQVNNIWLFVQKMRRELSQSILEFNKYPDRQDEITQNVQSITDQLKLVQQQLEKLKGADEKASTAIDELKAELEEALEEQNKAIEERLKDVRIIKPVNTNFISLLKTTGTGEEEVRQIFFKSTEDKSAIYTNIDGDDDGRYIFITQNAPGLLPENLAPRFTVKNGEDGFTTKVDEKAILKLEAESMDGDLVVPHIENVDDGEYRLTISSDGVESEIARIDGDIKNLLSKAASRYSTVTIHYEINGVNPIGFEILRDSLDGTYTDRRKINLTPTDRELFDYDIDRADGELSIKLDVKDQFHNAYPNHQASYTSIDGATITTSERAFSYDKEEHEVKISEPFNTKKLAFTTTPDDKHATYFEVDQAGNVAINTAAVENKIEKNATAATSRMDTLQARLVELEEKVRRLETRAVNQITSSNIRVEPRQGDKLAIILENYYANGKHEEKQAVINFTNQDGALVFHTRDQGITDQTEMFINMNNSWLEKQGLSSTTNA